MAREISCVLLAEELDLEMSWAWRRHCSEIPRVSFYSGNFLRAPIDALVLTPDSFGHLMTNEDKLIMTRWPHLEGQILTGIRTTLRGELAVGQAIVLPTGTNDIRGVVVSPATFAGLPQRNGPWPYLLTRAAIHAMEMSDILGDSAVRLGICASKLWRDLVPADSWARQVSEAILSLRDPFFISGNASDSMMRVSRIIGSVECMSSREKRAILKSMNEHGWSLRSERWTHAGMDEWMSSKDAISIWRRGGIFGRSRGVWGVWIDPDMDGAEYSGRFIQFGRIYDWLEREGQRDKGLPLER